MQIQKKLRRMLLGITAIIIMPSILGTAAAEPVQAKINSASAQVFKSLSVDSASVNGLENLTVTVTAWQDGWAQVQYRGKTGYIEMRHLNLSERIRAYTTTAAEVYQSAGSGSMGTLREGSQLYVTGVDGDYCRVQNAEGSVTGYVRSDLITSQAPRAMALTSTTSALPEGLSSVTDAIDASSTPRQRLEYALYLAQNALGKDSVCTPNPPESFDSASLIAYCYGRAGFGMDVDFAKESMQVAYTALQRGDIVCFDTDSGDDDLRDHMGIYLGGGYFIHASSGAGRVIVSSMEKDAYSYYRKVFSCGIRLG